MILRAKFEDASAGEEQSKEKQGGQASSSSQKVRDKDWMQQVTSNRRCPKTTLSQIAGLFVP